MSTTIHTSGFSQNFLIHQEVASIYQRWFLVISEIGTVCECNCIIVGKWIIWFWSTVCGNQRYANQMTYATLKHFSKLVRWILRPVCSRTERPAVNTVVLDEYVPGSMPGRTNLGNEVLLSLFWSKDLP